MESFIEHLAQIINHQPVEGNELCIVLPNRRAGLFLKRNLVPQNGKPRWVPSIMSVEDFVFSVSRLKEPDNVTLLANLYKAHCNISEKVVSFDNFLSWGTEILRDFEETDQYMVDPDNLFHYIRDVKEIDVWKPGEEQTEFEKNYIAFYESLADHYTALKEILLHNNQAYQGLAGRQIAEQPQRFLDELPWKKIIFAGFNALTPVQLVIIKYLIKAGKGEIIWDADEYYLSDDNQEAGLFLRQYKQDKELGPFVTVTNNFSGNGKNLYTCGIPGKVGQARIAGCILNEIPPESYQNTAIVLADESLLLPVLNSLPEGIHKFNVTMGFPLTQAPLYSLIDCIFQLHVNALNGTSEYPSFYHQDVVSILQNNYLYRIIDHRTANDLINKIRKNNYAYINFKEMLSLKSEAELQPVRSIFSGIKSTIGILTLLVEIIEKLKDTSGGVERAMEANEPGIAKGVESQGHDHQRMAVPVNESGLAKRVENTNEANESGLANGVENTNEVKEPGLAFIVNKTGKTGFEGKNDSADKVSKSDIDDMADTDQEILYCLYQKVNDLKNCLEREEIQIESLLTLYNFFREIAGSTRVPFYGEPLQGIQVMGMLETRVLDFENIILLSANEDVLPSAKSNKSFIPFDIRKHFNLPTHQERQAVFAYHFYKLLQRSSQAWLVYNEDDSGLGGGEKSRYIRQLEWELPGKGVNLIPLTPSADDAEGTKPWEISIEKTDTVLQKLAEKADKGFSFSSIKQYINCPLSFYFSYILGIEEIEEVEEDISVRTMGTIIHAVLEKLYKDSVNTFPDINKLKEAAKNAQTLIAGSTKDTYPALKIDSGKNLLFLKVAETWLKRFLESEIRLIEKDKAPVIMGIEHPLLRKIAIDLPGNTTREVTLYGKLDRIDVSQGNLRVIDYKTGAVDAKDLVVKSVDELFDPDKKFDKKLQLSFYKFIAKSDATFSKYNICPGIISFRSLSKGFLELDSQVDDDTFELRLKELLNDMFNPGIKFTQTELKNCKYCNFQQICHRIIKNNF